jgi:Cft2 family RNA processing exonuclease
MDFPNILHRGTALVVLSYCYKLFMDAANGLLVAYGLFQSAETSPDGNAGQGATPSSHPLDGIEALVVNHVHVDDVGRFPYQLAAGFKDPFICSEQSVKLFPIALGGASKLGIIRGNNQVRRYLKRLEQRFIALSYGAGLACSIRKPFAREFACSVPVASVQPISRLTCTTSSLARKNVSISPAMWAHPMRSFWRPSSRKLSTSLLEHVLSNQGAAFIPAFSIGRT